ncbi:MAG: ABC transporter permease [Betaproteobacteria bacterium]
MSFWSSLVQTVAAVLRDRGLALMFVAAVPAYSFFYPLPYATEAVREVPVVVVDRDASSLSRDIVARLAAVPAVHVAGTATAVGEATAALAGGEIGGIVLIPENFARDVARGTPTAVTAFGTGAYPVQDKAVLGSVGAVMQGVATELGGARLAREGAPAAALQQAARAGPVFIDQSLFNLAHGYGSYVVAAVGILIVQQMMLIAIAALVGTWLETHGGTLFGPVPPGWRGFAGTLTGFGVFAFLSLLYFIGFVFWLQDYPRGGNFGGALTFAALTALTFASLGIALGAWFADRERAFQVLLGTSVPFLFVCGIVFPREAMPAPVNALALLIPTTPGIMGFVKLNQMGATWNEVRPEALNMAALLLLYTLLAAWAMQRRRATATAAR